MKKNVVQTISLSFIVVLAFLVFSCNPSKQYEDREKSQIQDYLSSNSSLNFVLEHSGLYYLEVQAGTGRAPVTHDTVSVKYTLKLLDGTIVYTNVGISDILIFPFGENYMLPGFEEGIGYMKQGGKSLLLLPSNLAYGTTGNNYTIPGYTPLLFDIELVNVKPGPGK